MPAAALTGRRNCGRVHNRDSCGSSARCRGCGAICSPTRTAHRRRRGGRSGAAREPRLPRHPPAGSQLHRVCPNPRPAAERPSMTVKRFLTRDVTLQDLHMPFGRRYSHSIHQGPHTCCCCCCCCAAFAARCCSCGSASAVPAAVPLPLCAALATPAALPPEAAPLLLRAPPLVHAFPAVQISGGFLGCCCCCCCR